MIVSPPTSLPLTSLGHLLDIGMPIDNAQDLGLPMIVPQQPGTQATLLDFGVDSSSLDFPLSRPVSFDIVCDRCLPKGENPLLERENAGDGVSGEKSSDVPALFAWSSSSAWSSPSSWSAVLCVRIFSPVFL